MLWELILFLWLFVICVEEENKKAARTEEECGHVQKVFVKLTEVEVFFLREVRLFSLRNLFLGLGPFRVANANFLGPCSHSVRWVTHNGVKDRSHWDSRGCLSHVKLDHTHVHRYNIGAGELVVEEVRVDVEFSDLIEPLNAFVFGLGTDGVPFEDAHINITA